MTRWFILALLFSLDGYYSEVHQRNETKVADHASTQLKSTGGTPPDSVLHATNDGLTSSQDVVTDSTTPVMFKSTTASSNSRNKNRDRVHKSPATSTPVPQRLAAIKITTTINAPAPSSKFSVEAETKPKILTMTTPDPMTSTTFVASSLKSLTATGVHQHPTESSNGNVKHDTQQNFDNATPSKVVPTNPLRVHSTTYDSQYPEKETSIKPETTTYETTESTTDFATSTPTDSFSEEETSTLVMTEPNDSTYSENYETTTDYTSENVLSEVTTTELSVDALTTEFANEEKNENSTEGRSTIPNGLSTYENNPIIGVTSPLAKLVLLLSKPGAFEKGKSVFDDDAGTVTTSCPPGDVGLSCRREEARRGADECSGGNCEVCRSCNDMAATDWPHCCRENFRCCSELALACQQCDEPTLQVFCTKHFKRCF